MIVKTKKMLCHRDILNSPCPECSAHKWEVRKFKNQGGSITYPYVCGNCGLKTQLCENKKVAEKMLTSEVEIQPIYKRHNCEVCGNDGAENHHWAPYHLFGSECERWPTSYLCVECHRR